MKKQKSMFFSSNAEKYTWRTLLLEIVMLVICCIVVLPFYYLFVSVFKTMREMGLNPLGLPGSPLPGELQVRVGADPFLAGVRQHAAHHLLHAYYCCAVRFHGRLRRRPKKVEVLRLVMLYFLLGFMVPFQTTMIPLYQQMQFFGLINKIYGLIILSTAAVCLPFSCTRALSRRCPMSWRNPLSSTEPSPSACSSRSPSRCSADYRHHGDFPCDVELETIS